MVEIDQSKGISMRYINPQEEGRVRPKPNDELGKVQIETAA